LQASVFCPQPAILCLQTVNFRLKVSLLGRQHFQAFLKDEGFQPLLSHG
jgi:hypothetical protein